jgi:NAD+ synthase (glutamine-hydrolysing)
MTHPFFNLYSHGFARVAVGVPECRVADPAFNAEQTIRWRARRPTAAPCWWRFRNWACRLTCDDLFHQRALLRCELALQRIVEASAGSTRR